MSADNWSVCPKCLDAKRVAAEKARQALDTKYGKVDRETYKDLERVAAEAEARYSDRQDATFREDYEFYGADEGTVTASYRGSCKTCGLTVKFDHAVDFYPEPQS